MTYVSYFPEAKLKNGAPLKPKMTSASKCSASGPGLEEHGVIVKKPANFTVHMSGSSKGKLNVQVFGPGRKQIDCMVQDNQDNTYSCQYEPPKEGELLEIIQFWTQHEILHRLIYHCFDEVQKFPFLTGMENDSREEIQASMFWVQIFSFLHEFG